MYGYLGEIRLVAFNFIPTNYVLCDGRRFNKYIVDNIPTDLYAIIGDAFTYDNSDPNTFAIPDLRNRFILQPENSAGVGKKKGKDEIVLTMNQMPKHNHETKIECDNTNGGEDTSNLPKDSFLNNQAGVFSTEASNDTYLAGISQENVGSSKPINIKNAHLKMVYIIRVFDEPDVDIIGEIRIWPNSKINGEKGHVPKGWKLCNGETLQVSRETALSAVIGFNYGGSVARNEFKLPDFRNRFAAGLDDKASVGETGGKKTIRLNKNQLPSHTHHVKLNVNNNAVSTPHVQIPNGAYINSNAGKFSTETNFLTNLGGVLEEDKGGTASTNIENTSLGLNYIICVKGYPPVGKLNRFAGEVMLFAGVNPERLTSYLPCYGQNLSLFYYEKLFYAIRKIYGSDDKTFKLPDLRNKIPLCVTTPDEVGEYNGSNKIKLTVSNLPEHHHNIKLAANHSSDGRRLSISNGILNKDAGMFSTKNSNNIFLGGVKESSFIGEDVDIRNPYLAINYLICVDGSYPR